MESFLVPEMWIKLALAILCGAAIGIERELHDKPAGLRTNMLICVGSTLITMVSLHVALTYAGHQEAGRSDRGPARSRRRAGRAGERVTRS